ncbi:hypothetical protein GCM10022243_38200 [Saccharothrix violaceirubra]|uniref:TIR domain-containing protein n=1 Tax=Saccharothrix violaceirubra TaxID=413306 RepID=A0A7W7T4R4_9PSEU|nr:toll/interleukin-1 receptor domain-containing protein [Saccharothrix violaceirubra]MBB4966266.1 hypothetical protein [Saccharothrix violaceirubra]
MKPVWTIFISHSTANQPKDATSCRLLELIVEEFTGGGYEVRYDRDFRAGDDWRPQIYEFVNCSHVGILLLDNRARVDSEWVRTEYDYMFGRHLGQSLKLIVVDVESPDPATGKEWWTNLRIPHGIKYDGDESLISSLRTLMPKFPVDMPVGEFLRIRRLSNRLRPVDFPDVRLRHILDELVGSPAGLPLYPIEMLVYRLLRHQLSDVMIKTLFDAEDLFERLGKSAAERVAEQLAASWIEPVPAAEVLSTAIADKSMVVCGPCVDPLTAKRFVRQGTFWASEGEVQIREFDEMPEPPEDVLAVEVDKAFEYYDWDVEVPGQVRRFVIADVGTDPRAGFAVADEVRSRRRGVVVVLWSRPGADPLAEATPAELADCIVGLPEQTARERVVARQIKKLYRALKVEPLPCPPIA